MGVRPNHRTTLHFHDVIEPGRDLILPTRDHVAAVLEFGSQLTEAKDTHVLVHCHMGISRSTAALTTLLAHAHEGDDEDRIFRRRLGIRPQAWPNLVMVAYADDLLGRRGRLTQALGRLYARQLARRPETGRYMRQNGRARKVDMAERASVTT